jgi:hypothetical protein
VAVKRVKESANNSLQQREHQRATGVVCRLLIPMAAAPVHACRYAQQTAHPHCASLFLVYTSKYTFKWDKGACAAAAVGVSVPSFLLPGHPPTTPTYLQQCRAAHLGLRAVAAVHPAGLLQVKQGQQLLPFDRLAGAAAVGAGREVRREGDQVVLPVTGAGLVGSCCLALPLLLLLLVVVVVLRGTTCCWCCCSGCTAGGRAGAAAAAAGRRQPVARHAVQVARLHGQCRVADLLLAAARGAAGLRGARCRCQGTPAAGIRGAGAHGDASLVIR